MSDPHEALKRALLRAGKGDAPPPDAKRQLLDALGLRDDVVSVAGAPMSGVRRARVADWRERPPLFASAVEQGGAFYKRLGAPTVVSLVAHAAVLALVLLSETRAPQGHVKEPELTVRLSATTTSAPKAPSGGAARVDIDPPQDPAPAAKPGALVAAHSREERPMVSDVVPGAPAPIEPAGSHAAASAPAVVAGDPAGAAGNDVIAAPPPPPSEEILPFGEGMNRPQRIDGPEPVYPREAREARVEGTMLVKCVITTQGSLQRCQVLKSLPFMDQPVLSALARQRYTPVTFQGRPVNVEYVIPLKFELP